MSLTKHYTNGEITVTWKPDTCEHAKHCWTQLSGVFNPKERPWINMMGATSDEILAQVKKCPSGALSAKRNEELRAEAGVSQDVHIEIVPNGPVRIQGNVEIKHSNGELEHRERATSLCRCGMSSKKPFCDGTHKREGWKESED